jgi:crossover junction endodeoxyribonuclease RusA
MKAEPLLTITLPWPATELWPNRNTGRHWTYKSDAVATSRMDAKIETSKVLRKSVDLSRLTTLAVVFIFQPPTRRRYDLENVYSAMKGYQDGIADALGVDDSCFEPVILKRGEPHKGGQVVVMIGVSI